jgi:hypothetical protein
MKHVRMRLIPSYRSILARGWQGLRVQSMRDRHCSPSRRIDVVCMGMRWILVDVEVAIGIKGIHAHDE